MTEPKDPYDFLPNNEGELTKESAERLIRSAQKNVSVPETNDDFEKFRQSIESTPQKREAPKTIVYGEELNNSEPIKEDINQSQIKDYAEIKDRIERHSSTEYFKNNDEINPNPLKDFFRNPEIFVRLPSQGIFNKTSDINFTVDGQIGIYPMTAQDELILRTPDALMNGSALEQLVRSCAPAIKNVRALSSPDFDIILLGIRLVSFGNQLDYNSPCPKCKHQNEFGVDINTILDSVTAIKGPGLITLKNGLKIKVIPYTFDATTKAAIVAFEEAQLIRAVTKQDIEEAQKLLQFNDSLNRIAKLNRELFAESIVEIITPNNQSISNKDHILEFLENISKNDFDQIEEKIKDLNNSGFQRNVDVKCAKEKCGHEYKLAINYDPTSFFGKSF